MMASAVARVDFSKVKVVREVAVPQLSIKGANVQVAIRITSPITAGNSDKDSGKPVYSCKVIDLTDGVEKSLVMPAIPRSELTRTYPDHTYVGKEFGLMKEGEVAGKRYNAWKIMEIDTSEAQVIDAVESVDDLPF